MLYIVEVTLNAETLGHELNRMRIWLDHMKFETAGFKRVPDTDICRIDFKGELQARAFAQMFSGEILDRTAA